ncbi:MAG: hypothetical protein D6806_09905, partial [Deltaproteobacteria bacterium]
MFRNRTRWILGTVAAAMVAVLLPSQARAQGDDPTLVIPEVLIIFDTSGSMGWGSYPPFPGTNCNFQRNRLGSGIEVLAGALITDPKCKWITGTADNGILDIYGDMLRFGFATFDNEWVGSCWAHNGGDRWNYGDDLSGDGRRFGIKGRKGNTSATDNGGTGGNRWGNLIDVVDAGNPDNLKNHTQTVENELLGIYATGCTPLAPALWDANYYFNNFESEIGYNDPLTSCRPKFVILVSDGQENLGFGSSRYVNAAAQAANLCANDIPVFVIGFQGEGENLRPWLDPIALAGSSGSCNPTGTPIPAFIAQDPAQLFSALDLVIRSILSGAASRTEVTSVPSLTDFDTSYTYASYFGVSLTGGWEGHLLRIPIPPDDGNNNSIPDALENLDLESPPSGTIDFADTLYQQVEVNGNRTVYQVVDDPRSQTFINSDGTYDETTYPRPKTTSGLFPLGHGGMHDPPANWMCYSSSSSDNHHEHHELVRWINRESKAQNAAGEPLDHSSPVLGDIFHSNPQVVTPPSALAPDYRYEQYFLQNAKRPTMVYVGANDGMLHAFVGEDPRTGGYAPGTELWGFIPNAILRKLHKLRMGHDVFVDGTPVVRDVMFYDSVLKDKDGNVIKDADNNPVKGAFRTVLISGLRGGGNAYFALDVTDPENPKYLWEYRPHVDPTEDYHSVQCEESLLESWARPVVGRVWLHNAHAGEGTPPEPEFVGRSVAIVPGGYIPPDKLTQATSCLDFVKRIEAASSVHIIDIETGRLLKKFVFSNSVSETDIDNFLQSYDDLVSDSVDDSTQSWEGCISSNDADFGGSGCNPAWGADESKILGKSGWQCYEKRERVDTPVAFPMKQANCKTVEDTPYKKKVECCWKQSDPHNDCNPTGVGACHYTEVYLKESGAVVKSVKGGPSCPYGNSEFILRVGEKFTLESVAGDLVGYSTAYDQYLTRVFVPTTAGRIWRIDLSSGEFQRTLCDATDCTDVVGT